MTSYKCPKCGQTETFGAWIIVEAAVDAAGEVDPDSADLRNAEIDTVADMECPFCGYTSISRGFDEDYKKALEMFKCGHF